MGVDRCGLLRLGLALLGLRLGRVGDRFGGNFLGLRGSLRRGGLLGGAPGDLAELPNDLLELVRVREKRLVLLRILDGRDIAASFRARGEEVDLEVLLALAVPPGELDEGVGHAGLRGFAEEVPEGNVGLAVVVVLLRLVRFMCVFLLLGALERPGKPAVQVLQIAELVLVGHEVRQLEIELVQILEGLQGNRPRGDAVAAVGNRRSERRQGLGEGLIDDLFIAFAVVRILHRLAVDDLRTFAGRRYKRDEDARVGNLVPVLVLRHARVFKRAEKGAAFVGHESDFLVLCAPLLPREPNVAGCRWHLPWLAVLVSTYDGGREIFLGHRAELGDPLDRRLVAKRCGPILGVGAGDEVCPARLLREEHENVEVIDLVLVLLGRADPRAVDQGADRELLLGGEDDVSLQAELIHPFRHARKSTIRNDLAEHRGEKMNSRRMHEPVLLIPNEILGVGENVDVGVTEALGGLDHLLGGMSRLKKRCRLRGVQRDEFGNLRHEGVESALVCRLFLGRGLDRWQREAACLGGLHGFRLLVVAVWF